MEIGLEVRESDLKRCSAVGEGESLADWLKAWVADGGADVSIVSLLGIRDVAADPAWWESVDPPHCDMKESTAFHVRGWVVINSWACSSGFTYRVSEAFCLISVCFSNYEVALKEGASADRDPKPPMARNVQDKNCVAVVKARGGWCLKD